MKLDIANYTQLFKSYLLTYLLTCHKRHLMSTKQQHEQNNKSDTHITNKTLQD